MKKELIEILVKELENEGYDVSGLICEEGVMNGNYGIMEWSEFDDIDDEELKDYLIDAIEEMEGEERDI